MQHNAPHAGAAFEGYYNKFTLPSGAQLVVVISKINRVKVNPNVLSFTYIPHDARPMYQKELFIDALELRRVEKTGNAFVLDMPGIGFAKWNEDGMTEYSFNHAAFSLHAQTTTRVPWSSDTDTPEGPLVHLPLPLHWHVQSFASQCKFKMNISDYDFPPEDAAGDATVHQEKNWATAFPTAHMWLQGRNGDKGICCAGGEILGVKAFLLGYRSSDLNFDFRPPFAVRMLGIGPFMSYSMDWEKRTFDLSVQSFKRKIAIHASAPVGSFYSLSPPFAEGHRENYLGQSLRAKIEVKIYESGWIGAWRLVREDVFEGGSLEFGAGYYPPAGTAAKFN